MKWFLATLALALTALCLWLVGAGDGDDEGLEAASRASVGALALDSGTLPALRDAGTSPRSAASSEKTTREESSAAVQPASDASASLEQRVRFLARVNGEDGTPLQLARLWSPGLEDHATSSMTGPGQLLHTLKREDVEGASLRFHVEAEGFASILVPVRWTGEEEQHLGSFALQRGRKVSGVVLDSLGRGVPGAHVCAAGVRESNLRSRRKDHAINGPTLGPRYLFGNSISQLSPETRTDINGRFIFENIPGMWTRIWARTDTSLWTWTEKIPLDPDHVTVDLELSIPDSADEDWIGGLLLDPAGNPVAGTSVHHNLIQGGDFGAAQTDAEGRFRIGLKQPGPRQLRAPASVWEWADLQVNNVLPGTTGLVLQFEEAQWVWARVTNRAGEGLSRGLVTCVVSAASLGQEAGPTRRLGRSISDLWEDGRARMHRPNQEFDLEVKAEGYENKRVGPFSMDTIDVIAIELERVRGLRVHVTAGGKAVPDAQLSLRRPAPEGKEYSPTWTGEGVPFGMDLSTHGPPVVSTNTNGRAILKRPSHETEADWTLMASAPGQASMYSRPLRASDFDEGLELELAFAPTASLGGTLRFPAGDDGLGWRAYACDGLAEILDVSVSPEGRFEFSSLHAGPWQVRAFRPGKSLQGRHPLRERASREVDVELRAGEHSTLTLTPPDHPQALLRGQLKIKGHDLGVWRGTLRYPHREFELDAEGRFQIDGVEPGNYSLVLRSLEDRFSHLSLKTDITLIAEENWWEQTLEFGAIEGTYHARLIREWPIPLHALWVDGAMQFSFSLRPDEENRISATWVPAGRYILGPHEAMWGMNGNTEERPVSEIDVRAGETVQINIDAR